VDLSFYKTSLKTKTTREKRSNHLEDWKLYYELKKECQKECQKAYNNYVNSFLDSGSGKTTKRFWLKEKGRSMQYTYPHSTVMKRL